MIFTLLSFGLRAQEEDRLIDANFLFSYYDQDGDHSAVDGGLGSQELTDISSVLILNVPVDSTRSYILDFGVNYYTSASSDNIDFVNSSASEHEWRGDFEFTYNWDNAKTQVSKGFSLGTSRDNDYQSFSFGYHRAKTFNNGMSQWLFKGKFFYDHWFHMFYPIELRDTSWVDTEHRQTLSIFNQLNRIVNKRLQVSFNSELVYQHGLLSTPFYRVYFPGEAKARVERLPAHRFKVPLSVRLNYFLGDRMVFRFYYRYYFDSWGVHGSTVSLETPVKIGPYLTVYPLFRYFTQSGARYFAPFNTHDPESDFYTSDYDLSSFDSFKVGAGIKYSPLNGIMKFSRKKYKLLKSIALRYAHYNRSDGLTYSIISSDFRFVF